MDRVGLDSPTEAYAVVKVNLLFVGSGGREQEELSRDFISAQLDSHFYDESLLDIGSTGESGFKYEFDIQTFHLETPTQTVLRALQRIVETNTVDIVEHGKHIRVVSARAMSKAIDRLVFALGLNSQTTLVIMDFASTPLGNAPKYGYRADTRLSALLTRLGTVKRRQDFARARLEALHNVYFDDLDTSVMNVSTGEEEATVGEHLEEDEEEVATETTHAQGRVTDELRVRSLAEAWASDELIELENKDSALSGYLHLDEFQEVEGNWTEGATDTSFIELGTSEGRNAVESLQLFLMNKSLQECSVDAWTSDGRTAWIDLTAGPFEWGVVPQPGGRPVGAVKSRHIIPTLASFLHSLILKHQPKGVSEDVYIRDHVAVQLYVIDTHYGYNILGEHSVRTGFNVRAFREQLRRFALPGQTSSFVVHHVDINEDPSLAVAFASSLRSATRPSVNATAEEIHLERFNFVDSEVLQFALERKLTRQEKNGVAHVHKTLVLPIFVFSVNAEVPLFVDSEHRIAKALADMVVVVQSSLDQYPSSLTCNGAQLSHSLRNPTKQALAATLELWGGLDLGARTDLSWSVGASFLSETNPFSDLAVPDILVDSFHRATISRVLAASHRMQRRAYEAIHASKDILKDRKHNIIGELHELESQLVVCWDKLIEFVKDMKWHPAFVLLKPLLRKSRLLLKVRNPRQWWVTVESKTMQAALRAAAAAKVSCDAHAEIHEIELPVAPTPNETTTSLPSLLILWVVGFAALFFWTILQLRREEYAWRPVASSPSLSHKDHPYRQSVVPKRTPQTLAARSRTKPRVGVRRRKRVQIN